MGITRYTPRTLYPGCARCRYVSFSKQRTECLWFSQCHGTKNNSKSNWCKQRYPNLSLTLTVTLTLALTLTLTLTLLQPLTLTLTRLKGRVSQFVTVQVSARLPLPVGMAALAR